MNKKIYLGIFAGLIILFFAVIYFQQNSLPKINNKQQENFSVEATSTFRTIIIGGATIKAEVADTEAKQIQGLSGRASLATSTGMLFAFNYPSYWGIWMKDMNFPIDVLWITGDFKISDIVENMLPASYPQDYKSNVPALYVLEIPAGTVKNNNIKVGENIVIK